MYVCMIWCRIQCLLGGEARRHVRRAADHARVCRPRRYGEENVLRLLGANQVRFDPLCCMYVFMHECRYDDVIRMSECVFVCKYVCVRVYV